MVSGCVCDPGWFGPDCTLRRCPTGDDPFTGMIGDVNGVQVNEKQIVTCVANGGSFTLEFDGQTTEAISFDAAVGDLVTHLEALKNVNSDYGSAIKVTYTGSNVIACTDAGNAITIEFLQNFGALPLLTPDGSRLDHSSALFEPLITSTSSVTGTKENVECSNRGICEENTGVCTCSEGFATSNGYCEAGQRGDCGFATETIIDCPGEVACNGVGVCSGAPRYLCECIEGYSGADCTEMVCPSGRSWFDFPVSTNSAHYSRTVCSDAGRCDKSTGTCECMVGFTGAACERTACAGDDVFCSGNGHCESVEQMARHANDNGDFLDVTYGVVENNPATWDYDKLYGCSCDAGFGGYDCSEMSCPFGDDPDSVEGQFNEVQEVTCEESDGSTDSSFTLKFRQETTASIAYTATVQDVEAALEALGGMLDVNVYLDASLAGTAVCGNNGGGVGGNVFYVEFFYPTGDVPLITGAGSGLESLTVVNSVRGNKEFLECSGRGLCNKETGICRCKQGYGSSDGQSGSGSIGDCGMRLLDIVAADEASTSNAIFFGGASDQVLARRQRERDQVLARRQREREAQ